MTFNIEGLVLESMYADYNLCVKGPIITDWADGFPKQVPKHIVLDFDSFICEVDDVVNKNELTDEDKQFVARTLERILKNPSFVDVWIHEKPKVNPPWPTYDSIPATQVAAMANSIGMVRDALTYETRGREPRDVVVKKLQELLGEDAGTPAEDLDLAAI